EIRRLVDTAYGEARKILAERRADLELLARSLLEFETLTGDEIKDLFQGKRPNRESVIEPATPRGSAGPAPGQPRPRPGGAGGRRERRLRHTDWPRPPRAGAFVFDSRPAAVDATARMRLCCGCSIGPRAAAAPVECHHAGGHGHPAQRPPAVAAAIGNPRQP